MATKRTPSLPAASKNKLNYATPALDKGLDVIELLAHQPEGMTKSQIARGLNRSVSEIFRMLVCLERRGYIALFASEKYSLTLKMFKLVQEHPPTERLIVDSLPSMHHFAHETLQSCHLGVLEDARVVILAQVNAPANIGFYVKLGSTVDIMDAASGYVILANQDEETRKRTIARWSQQTGKKLPRDLEIHLQRIRKAGFEKSASYLVKGIVNISFPIFDDRGSAVGALTAPFIQYTESAISVDKVTAALRDAATEITACIGGVRSKI